MPETSGKAVSETRLGHDQVQRLIQQFGDAGIINLDTSVRGLIEPVAATLKPGDGQTSLHIVCCNEYGLITR